MSDFSHKTDHPEHSHLLDDAEDALRFLLAGAAIITVVSLKTRRRFTYKVTQKTLQNGKEIHRVGVLTGPNNGSDYTSLGTIEDEQWRHWDRSRITEDAPSAVAFRYLWWCLYTRRALSPQMEVWTAGVCGKCLAPLTVDSSIKLGLGPICAGSLGAGHKIEWNALLPGGKQYTVHGPTENDARKELRSILGCKRLPKGVQVEII